MQHIQNNINTNESTQTVMKKFILCTLLLAIGFVTTVEAQKSYDELTFPELSEFNKPDVEKFTLDNGITFYLVEDRELPIIDMRVMVRSGGVMIPNEKAGLASMMATVMRQGGSENYPADSLNELLENNAATLEGGMGFTRGTFSLNVLKDDFDELLPVMIDLLKNPAFPQEKIDQALKQNKSGISRRNDNPQQVAFREFERLIYGQDSKYGRMVEYETLNTISREDLIELHDKAFAGQNLMIGVIGDFKTKQMKKLLKSSFGDYKAGEPVELTFPDIDYNYERTVNLIDKPDVNQSVVLMGHLGGLRTNPDYAKLQVMNEVLSGGFSGRLFQKVRTDLGLAYAVFGQYGSNTFYKGQFYTGVMTKSSTTAEAVDAIMKEIKRLQDEPITQKELEDTKEQFLNSMVFEYDTPEKILNQRMSYEYRGLDKDTFDKYVEKVKKVTIEDVQQVANKYLQPDKMEILVVGNKSEIGNQLDKYGNVNEIDISIPTPGSSNSEMAQKGDVAQGDELLKNMANAIVKPNADFESIKAGAQNTIYNSNAPGGKISRETSTTINFAEDTQTTNVSTPQGDLTIELDSGKAVMKMMGQERPLPGPQAKQMQASISRHYLNISLNANSYDAEYMGTEEYDGKTYDKLKVNLDKAVIFLLDPQSHLPHVVRYEQFSPQEGKQLTVEEIYENWKVENGIAFAYATKSEQDGEVATETTYNSVEFN